MRWVLDILAVLALAAAIGGFYALRSSEADDHALEARVSAATERLSRQIALRAATGGVDLNARGWPMTVDPAWFERGAPLNAMLDEADRPWIELAPIEQADLTHPPLRIATDKRYAAFWYNPYNGVVRARVPAQGADDLSVALYNRVNSSAIASVVDLNHDPSVLPLGARLITNHTAQQGSFAARTEDFSDLDPTAPRDELPAPGEGPPTP